MKKITSLQNPLIKQVFALQQKSKIRRELGRFVVEGKREILLARGAGYHFEQIFFLPSLVSPADLMRQLGLLSDAILVEVSPEVYKKIGYRETTEGVIGIALSPLHRLQDVDFQGENPLVLVAEAPEKPGNIGAILRTADAVGVDAVLIANPKTDLYNPNIIRASVGCVFTTPIAMGSSSEIIAFLKEKNIRIFCAALSASKPYDEISFCQSAAVVVGTEDVGLSQEWLQNSTQNIIIPMQGKIDSMNVSVSAAVILFEAQRQRKISTK